jgi:uncharacterized membrane protein YfcA
MSSATRKILISSAATTGLSAFFFFVPDIVYALQPHAVEQTAWWVWMILLFIFSFVLGIFSVLAGVGGGVLFVPIVSGFFPFHLDFVRGAGLLVALSGAISAGAPLMRKGLADLKLGLPMALVGSISSIAGAMAGLAMPVNVVQLLLGVAIMGIATIMIKARAHGSPEYKEPDALSKMLDISGVYYEESTRSEISWQIHRTPLGLFLFMLIGFIGGMFGMGAGWANVPVFNLLMGVPLKVAVATSGLVLSINGAAAAWVYIYKGAVVPLIAVPAIGGIMLGSKIGAKLLTKVNTRSVRLIVIIILVIAGLRSLLKGFGI